ncbi:hypothetical protein CKAH01_11552 [Colletotrichum kahawae]|uniref:Uncharacterized protein n=1 Tax=Colletotrichum kahawae TaxID=34407 RepID=A0AAD9YT78_COLKA|nr:hypothetical protein CKAH01_11552 [Colletotrichum kahawae]
MVISRSLEIVNELLISRVKTRPSGEVSEDELETLDCFLDSLKMCCALRLVAFEVFLEDYAPKHGQAG